MDRGAWQAIVHGTAELDTTEQLHFPKKAITKLNDIIEYPEHQNLPYTDHKSYSLFYCLSSET